MGRFSPSQVASDSPVNSPLPTTPPTQAPSGIPPLDTPTGSPELEVEPEKEKRTGMQYLSSNLLKEVNYFCLE